MQVQVKGKGVVVTDALRDYAEKKVGRLTNHFANLNSATVTEKIEGKMHRVEVQLVGDGITLRGEDHSGGDLYAAIDRVVDKLERQVQKHKARKRRHHHYGNHGEVASPRTAPPDVVGLEEQEPDEDTGRIVRHKRFAIKPITPVEAVEQMELLSHNFFVFENSDSGEVNVLYRRDDGNFGILQPER